MLREHGGIVDLFRDAVVDLTTAGVTASLRLYAMRHAVVVIQSEKRSGTSSKHTLLGKTVTFNLGERLCILWCNYFSTNQIQCFLELFLSYRGLPLHFSMDSFNANTMQSNTIMQSQDSKAIRPLFDSCFLPYHRK